MDQTTSLWKSPVLLHVVSAEGDRREGKDELSTDQTIKWNGKK